MNETPKPGTNDPRPSRRSLYGLDGLGWNYVVAFLFLAVAAFFAFAFKAPGGPA